MPVSIDGKTLQSGHGFRMEIATGRGSAGADVAALVPAAGAPHADAFRVTTLESDSAWGRPIMDVPTGRHQKFNPSSRTTDKGRLTVRLLDEALDPADQTVRWVSAFLDTADQKDQLARLKVTIWETHDFGTTWDYYFTGRVSADGFESGTTVYRIDLSDLSGDLEFDVFVGVPMLNGDGVRYAYPQTCLPMGIPFDYLGLKATEPMRGAAAMQAGKRFIMSDGEAGRARRASISEAFKSLADDVAITTPVFDFLPQYALLFNGDQCHVYVYPESSPATELGPYPLREIDLWEPSDATDQHYRCKGAYADGFNADLATGTRYLYRIVRNGFVDGGFPMLIGQLAGVHPVQLWKDIAQGYFSRRDPDTGLPAYSMAIDEAAFDALIADPSFGVMHDMPTKVWSAIEYIEDVICASFGLGWKLDGRGRVVPIDLRLTAGRVSEFRITDDDLTDNPDAFQRGGESRDAITAVHAKYYVDQQLSLDAEKGTGAWTSVAQTYIETHEVPIEFADFTPKARDIGDQAIDWDAQGLRLGLARDGRITDTGSRVARPRGTGAVTANDASRNNVVARIIGAIAERRRPFRSKPNTYTLEVDRTDDLLAIAIGQYGIVDLEQNVDPATHERGGARCGLVCSVEILDAVTMGLEILDVGPADLVTDPENPTPLGADPPVLDDYQLVAGTVAFTQVDTTLNAAGDAVMFRVAQTDATITDVADVPDAAWTLAGWTNLARVVAFGPFSGPRVWLQGRSEPGLGTQSGTTLAPSAWVSPLNAAYLDIDGIDPPTSPAVSGVTDRTATFSWIPAGDGFPLQVWYAVGTHTGAELAAGEGGPVTLLPPNSTELDLTGLAGPGVAVTLGVRHVDPPSGRVSSFAVVNFTTGAAGSLVAPRMAGVGLLGDA